jgi:hypothetical protein
MAFFGNQKIDDSGANRAGLTPQQTIFKDSPESRSLTIEPFSRIRLNVVPQQHW